MRRTPLLLTIFTVAVLVVAAVVIGLLYKTALRQETARLQEVAYSQARMIEAIARHEACYGHLIPAGSGHGDALVSTLAQVRDANERFGGFGRTGEFTLAHREGDSIVFLLTQRHPGSSHTMAIPFSGTSGEPMRRALAGFSGTVVGPDYRGVTVLAAHEPVSEFGLGIVAKVDLTEVQAPFIRAGLISILAALATVLLGSLLFYRITNPVLRQLQESEDRLRNAEHLAHLGSWTLDLAKNKLAWSDEAYRIFGLQPQEFEATYDAFLAAVHPDDRAEVDAAYTDSVHEDRDSYEIEHRVVRKNTGEVRIVLEKCEHVRDASGRIIRSTGMVHDITERKQAEEALRGSEGRLRKLYSAMSEGLALHQVVYDDSGRATDYRVIDVNPAFESITGISARQAVGALASQLYGTGSPPFLDVYSQVAETGTPTSFEIGWPPMAKSFHISAFSFAKGRFATVFTDVTERRRAEQTLQESEERFRTLAEATPDHVMLLDAELRIRYANFAAPGLSVEQLIGNPLPDFAPPGREAEIRALLQGVLKTGATSAYETVYEPPDGTAIYFESRAARLGSNRVVVVARDITERKRAEERLRATMGELERSNADLEQFAYVASHDLQEPLRMIASYVGLLSERYRGRLDERADRYVDYAVNGARRMQSLIDGLLDYARVGTKGRVAVAVDMAAAAAEAQANLSREITDANAAVEVGPLPVVPADRGQMVHVFQNLLSNAVKFHAENPPKVAVSARDIGQEWEFAVQDNGIGIDPKHSERVFGVFKRLHTAQEYPGTGIGLALCRKIVERHGGRIWLEPAEGGGSVFRFTLPKQPLTTFPPPAGREDKEA